MAHKSWNLIKRYLVFRSKKKAWTIVYKIKGRWANEQGDVLHNITYLLRENGIGERDVIYRLSGGGNKPDYKDHYIYTNVIFPWLNGVAVDLEYDMKEFIPRQHESISHIDSPIPSSLNIKLKDEKKATNKDSNIIQFSDHRKA